MAEEPLISAAQLARILGRHISYIRAAVRRGMPNVAGRYSVSQCMEWLRRHPHPRRRNGATQRKQTTK